MWFLSSIIVRLSPVTRHWGHVCEKIWEVMKVNLSERFLAILQLSYLDDWDGGVFIYQISYGDSCCSTSNIGSWSSSFTSSSSRSRYLDRFPSVIFLVQTLAPHLLIAYVRWAPNIVYRSHSTFACRVIRHGGSPPMTSDMMVLDMARTYHIVSAVSAAKSGLAGFSPLPISMNFFLLTPLILLYNRHIWAGGDQNVENENVEHTKMSSIQKCRGPGDAR